MSPPPQTLCFASRSLRQKSRREDTFFVTTSAAGAGQSRRVSPSVNHCAIHSLAVGILGQTMSATSLPEVILLFIDSCLEDNIITLI